MTQTEYSHESDAASILTIVNTTESEFTIQFSYAGGGLEGDTNFVTGDRSFGKKVVGDSGDLCVGFVGQSTLRQVDRANAGRRLVTVPTVQRMFLPKDAVNASRKTGGGTGDTNGLLRNDKTRTENDSVCIFLSCTNAISALYWLEEKL